MRFALIAGVLAAVVLAASTGAFAANGCGSAPLPRTNPLRACVFATGLAAGDYATTLATGSVTRPKSEISVVLYTSRPQPVDVSWTILCTRGLSAGTKTGQATLQTFKSGPAGGPTGHPGAWSIHEIKALPMANTDSCTVSAEAQLSGSGSLRLELLGEQR